MTGKVKLILAAAALAIVLGVLTFVAHLTGPRVVGQAVSPEGVEMCVVQRYNWSGEPFTTSFVFRKPGKNWGWFYFNHQDSYWGNSRVVMNPSNQTAVFYRGTAPAVTFDWASETYTLHRRNQIVTGAQNRLPAGWSPKRSTDWKP